MLWFVLTSHKLSSAGWILANQTVQFWRGAGPVDGHPDLTSTYRAELGGFVTILHIVFSTSEFHQLLEGNLTIYCDCQSAMNRLQKISYESLRDYLVEDFDLFHEGRTLLNRLKTFTSVTSSWVPHILNDAAHNLANDFLHKDQGYYNPGRVVIDPLSLEVSILHDQSTITSNLPRTLKIHYTLQHNATPFVKQKIGRKRSLIN